MQTPSSAAANPMPTRRTISPCIFASILLAVATTFMPVAVQAANQEIDMELHPVHTPFIVRNSNLRDQVQEDGISSGSGSALRLHTIDSRSLRGFPTDLAIEEGADYQHQRTSAPARPRRTGMHADSQYEVLPNWSGGRSLLHGTMKPSKYPKCTKCRMVRCNKDRSFCSGHCRQKRKLFTCDSTRRAPFDCRYPDGPPTLEDLIGSPPDAIGEYDALRVIAESPYFGCVNVGSATIGCPAVDTYVHVSDPNIRHWLLRVQATTCRARYYVPDCLAPLLPFGVCECTLDVPVHFGRSTTYRTQRRACVASLNPDLLPGGPWAGDPEGSEYEKLTTISADANETVTTYNGPIDTEDVPEYSYNVTANIEGVDVFVKLEIHPALLSFRSTFGDPPILTDGVVVLDDYDYEVSPGFPIFDYIEGSGDPEGGGGDAEGGTGEEGSRAAVEGGPEGGSSGAGPPPDPPVDVLPDPEYIYDYDYYFYTCGDYDHRGNFVGRDPRC